MQTVSILGATGSIGDSTLDVIRRNPERFTVYALTAGKNVTRLVQLCLEFRPRFAVVASQASYSELKLALKNVGLETTPLAGSDALIDVASADDVDTVMAAIVGAAGLMPTLAAVKAGKKVLLANKEALVMSGELFIDAVKNHKATLLPIDSEHNAIFQCLPASVQQQSSQTSLCNNGIAKILLTGSGGPFLNTPLSELSAMTPEQACKHPNWDMGRKISVDSATMMNKGLEFIEAKWLFNAKPADINVVIHPQSVIHSMVQYVDGSVIAQLGNPDMRTPIAHAMAFPERIESGVAPLDFTSMVDFSFVPPDYARFPCLKLAIDACNAGQWACTALNAANEVAVDAFLERSIRFTDISAVNHRVLDGVLPQQLNSLEQVVELDKMARMLAKQYLTESQ
ncbi:1-deoxy-D-xylulose-5-phosphate reductoisomerase [Corallincola spongiicola]|uniref:1-deoxy-D-xylulose 5-phosphate reductoisomerase n=1 Tax=Corallincola spongiicola TaxID=2520508 RepID=A0ABY1WMW3_9GAMM|nr:1-deoxy-D-xylulose-5-phosphate reductoisomerase [Corallincola spongiicola]TAA43766.1 1-deoxy-D-xylulose-5-phosphate reductoisomerase [Corallincola spongiicola]